MNRSLNRLLALAAVLLLAVAALADEGPPSPKPTRAFRADDYRSPRFHVTQADYKAKGLEVRMVQVRDRQNGFLCRGWLRIRPARGTPKWVYRGDIEAVGSSYGLFVPRTQPMPHFFLVVELNGYEGKLLLIDEKGRIREVPGGAYLVDRQRRLLFSLSFSDIPPYLIVLDLDSGQTVFQGFKEAVYQWHRLDFDLFFTTAKPGDSKFGSEENHATAYYYDAIRKAVIPRPLTPERWSRAEQEELEIDPRWYQDCTSEERRYGS